MALSKITNDGIDNITVDSSGNVGVGTTSPSAASNNAENLVINDSAGNSGVTIRTEAASGYSSIYFADSASYTVGRIEYQHGGNDMVFYTNASEAMRIDSSGNVLVGTTNTAPATQNSDLGIAITGSEGRIFTCTSGHHDFNRTSDGEILRFRSAANTEGSISVSGTTVSYNGGHLSRWSRLADDSKDTSIVKGTVMTNLDEMVEWGNEDNEQLNKMAVSSVEGDVNVSGVFVNWDDDDYWNDMNIAMTGDMVIRIASGTTVARGNLLMSAGDGTAKPQGDDIVRSKTIAKVTSTHVSHTYDDGSYLVPCVLMAC